MRGITKLYTDECEIVGCTTNSAILKLFMQLDLCDACPQHIDVHQNYLGRVGAIAFIRVLRYLQWVVSVDLRGTGLEDESVATLCAVVNGHPCLEVLDLRDNALFATSGNRLLRLLQNFLHSKQRRLTIQIDLEKLPLPLAAKFMEKAEKMNGLVCDPSTSRKSSLHDAGDEARRVWEGFARLSVAAPSSSFSPTIGMLRRHFKDVFVREYSRFGPPVVAVLLDFGPEYLASLRPLPDPSDGPLALVSFFMRSLRAWTELEDDLQMSDRSLLAEQLLLLHERCMQHDAVKSLHRQHLVARGKVDEEKEAALSDASAARLLACVSDAQGSVPTTLALYRHVTRGIAVRDRVTMELPHCLQEKCDPRLEEIRKTFLGDPIQRHSFLLLCTRAKYLLMNHKEESALWEKTYISGSVYGSSGDGSEATNWPSFSPLSGLELLEAALSSSFMEKRSALLHEFRAHLPADMVVYLAELPFRAMYGARENGDGGSSDAAQLPNVLRVLADVGDDNATTRFFKDFESWYCTKVIEQTGFIEYSTAEDAQSTHLTTSSYGVEVEAM